MCLEVIAMSSDVGCRVFFVCDAYMAACVVQHDVNRATSTVALLLFVVCNLQGSDCSFVLSFCLEIVSSFRSEQFCMAQILMPLN